MATGMFASLGLSYLYYISFRGFENFSSCSNLDQKIKNVTRMCLCWLNVFILAAEGHYNVSDGGHMAPLMHYLLFHIYIKKGIQSLGN